MKKSNKEIRDYANYGIQQLGGINELKNKLSETINDLSSEHGAIDNINQIHFYVRVLFYLKNEATLTQ
jgi:hypothetical protein